jgi:hypothetical protein
VVHLLETMVSADKVTDTLSEIERQGIAEADELLRRCEPLPHEEFGITMADCEDREPLPRAKAGLNS